MLLVAFAVALGINLLMFIPAYILKTDKLTDLSYGLSFIIVSGIFFLETGMGAGKAVLFAMITIWGLRLGTYLFIRIRRIKKDKRFDGIRENFFRFLGFWTLQGISVWAILIPSILYFSLEKPEFNTLAWIGVGIWLFGLLVETVADYQKYSFINNPDNKGKWIDRGLWRYSRHPNYFGEILNWVGIYIFTLSALSGADVWIGLAGPLYITILLLFVSGIPKLEKQADEKWGEIPTYVEYKRRTSTLVLLPKKKV